MITKTLRVLMCSVAAVSGSAAIGQSAGSMRTLIAPNAAVDAATYEEYQRCLAAVKLNQDLSKVAAAREACKKKALASAYRLPTQSEQTKTGVNLYAAPSVNERLEAQQQKLERYEQ